MECHKILALVKIRFLAYFSLFISHLSFWSSHYHSSNDSRVTRIKVRNSKNRGWLNLIQINYFCQCIIPWLKFKLCFIKLNTVHTNFSTNLLLLTNLFIYWYCIGLYSFHKLAKIFSAFNRYVLITLVYIIVYVMKFNISYR